MMRRKPTGESQARLNPAQIVHDGGKEHTINLDWEDEGEVEKQGGCIPQKHRHISLPEKQSPVIFILPKSRHLAPVSHKWLKRHDFHVVASLKSTGTSVS